MNCIQDEIGTNQPLNRWWITDVKRTPFHSPCEAFQAEVNEGEAYVQIVYPVRKAFLKSLPIRQAACYEGEYESIYFPFENSRVDFTTFIHTPHHISVNAMTQILAAEDGLYPFDVFTCGGVKIWVNGVEQICFTPYTRNIASKISLELPLKKGENELKVYADELAERDVFFYFEIRYQGSMPLTASLPVDVPAEDIRQAEAFLTSCYFERDVVTEGPLVLRFDEGILTGPARLTVAGEIDPEILRLGNVEAGTGICETVFPDMGALLLGDISYYNVGVFSLYVSLQVGRHCISRKMVVGTMPPDKVTAVPSKHLSERKKQALAFIAEHGELVVNRALAILSARHCMTQMARECMERSIEVIESKEDCADFYLAPLMFLYDRYRNCLTQNDAARIKNAVLRFRYWIDEPGNDVMWYFSENHALLFHVGQYLAGCLFEKDEFTASGRLGAQQCKIGMERLTRWFDRFLSCGYAEWNSATYLPVDLIGFFCLHLMAPDLPMRRLAERALDMTFRVIGYHQFYGVMASSFGRAYEETLKAPILTEPNFLAWIATGSGYLTSGSRAAALFALSDYCPPSYEKEVQVGRRQYAAIEWDQGVQRVKICTYRTSSYILSCVRRYKPFVHGHQQHLMHASMGTRAASFFINHPGERLFSGGNRPSYWAGNGTIPFVEQYKGLQLMVFHIAAEELVHGIHAYAPLYLYDEALVDENWFFAKVEDAYLGVRFSGPFHITATGANRNKELFSSGLNHAIIIRMGNPAEFGSFDDFRHRLKRAEFAWDGAEHVAFGDPNYGTLCMKGIADITVNGRMLPYETAAEPRIEIGVLERG